eukprot:CAMPEP_0202352618 /NCGR_PEP_ID=MMETSP1126-20121109/8732_1 /ASSEMBLY_ACC=CAM_ASM_000457 /TAXON_ID=3047 /ORGANISM="Dunaliella tertiolecta, Strain CCMP1320" /LENGTH=133 /DNA_ID=CAMNT_0048944853 /DNA_START=486 /DNA_END=887 /DNA_ORIENTATION=+
MSKSVHSSPSSSPETSAPSASKAPSAPASISSSTSTTKTTPSSATATPSKASSAPTPITTPTTASSTSAPWGRCSLGLGQEPLHGQQPEGVNVEFLPGAIASGNDALGHLDGEVHIIDRSQDLLHLAYLGLVF